MHLKAVWLATENKPQSFSQQYIPRHLLQFLTNYQEHKPLLVCCPSKITANITRNKQKNKEKQQGLKAGKKGKERG